MIKNISIVSKNLISIELFDKQDLENFIKIFTVLDKHKAARTLFAEEVSIEYKQCNGIEVVELFKDTNFTYNDVENILHHLSKHGMEVNHNTMENTLLAAYNNALDLKDIAFSLFSGLPQFNIRVKRNTFKITPIREEHLELNSKNSKAFIELLKNEKSMYDCMVTEGTIDIVVPSEIHQAINSIIKLLIKSELLAKEEEEKLKERLRQLAFKDQAFSEYSSIKRINQYPHDHPFGKHRDITKGIENILFDFIENENSKSTIEQLSALNASKVSPETPRIITKTIDKLVKLH